MDLIQGLKAWLRSRCSILLRLAVRRAPPHLRERLAEEWEAHLDGTPGNLTKLVLALDLVRASGTLRSDAEAADREEGAAKEIRDREFPVGVTHAIVDPAAGLAVATKIVVSGWDALGYELRQEQAATIGRLARELRETLDALDSFDRRARGSGAAADAPAMQRVRARRVDNAAYALWHFVVQRECMGFRGTEGVLVDYAVPAEVRARMGTVGRPAGGDAR